MGSDGGFGFGFFTFGHDFGTFGDLGLGLGLGLDNMTCQKMSPFMFQLS